VPHHHNFRRCRARRVPATIHSEHLQFHAQDSVRDNDLDLVKVDKVHKVRRSDLDNVLRWQDLVLVQCVLDSLHVHNKVVQVQGPVDLVAVDLALAHKVVQVDHLPIELKAHVLVVQVPVVDLLDVPVDPVQVVDDPEVPVDVALLLAHSERERRSRRSRSRRRLSAKRSTICKHPYWVACASLVAMDRRSGFAAERHSLILQRR
jgi:hypothetical protein